MNKNKKIGITVAVIIIIAAVGAAGIYAYLRHQQVEQYNAVMTEVEMINDITGQEYTGNIDREELNSLLERRVADGKYGQVEDAFKSYMSDLYTIVYDTTDTAKNSSVSSFLTAENIEKDGPSFETSKATADSVITKLQGYKESYNNMVNADAVSSYAQRAGLEGKYLGLYNKILSAHSAYDSSESNKFTASIDSTVSKLTAAKEAMDFLSSHQDSWNLKDGKIAFTSEEVYKEFTEIESKF